MLVALFACAPAPNAGQIPDATTPDLLLLVHGGGDDPSVWADAMGDVAKDALLVPEEWTVYAYDWRDAAAGSTSAAPNGLVEGEAVGERLASAGYEHVHFVAHSVGSFVVDGALNVAHDYTAHATFLDPFCFLDIGRAAYGNREFGAGADFAESYLDADDPTPSTSLPLDRAHTFDVTTLRPASIDAADGHRWPITWYEASFTGGDLGAAWSAERTGELDTSLPERFPAGETTVLE